MQIKRDISGARGIDTLFASTKNTRPLSVGRVPYIRSDVPTAVTEEERRLLLSLGVTLVIDLRTEAERLAKPCPLAGDPRFIYECYPLTGGDTVPPCPAAVPASYIAMADATFRAVIARLLSAETGALYFCNAGKDRTGTVSAALLYHLGAPRAAIVGDYMQSGVFLCAALAAYAKATPGVDVAVITPHENYIEEFLSWYASHNDNK